MSLNLNALETSFDLVAPRGDELEEAARDLQPTRWLDAARAYVAGRAAEAADLYAEIGASPEETYVRRQLGAGRTLYGRGAVSTSSSIGSAPRSSFRYL